MTTPTPLTFTDADYGIATLADGTIVEADTGAIIVPAVKIAFTVDMPVRGLNRAATKIARDAAIQDVSRAINASLYADDAVSS